MTQPWIPAALALLLFLVLAPPARADDAPVVVRLRSGEEVRGTLLGFGERVFKVQVGERVESIAEADVAGLSFPEPAPKALHTPVHRPPEEVTAKPFPGGVEVTWASSRENEYVVVTAYEVLRCSRSGEVLEVVARLEPTATRWVDCS